ncbi:hypothetical protein O6H91_03G040600 [Diphasiastrum complanatum]|uniref:Uncharacterized protein n=2 Tax=Diphasiastrum complanatum TaxID=34168 RepID=A0ACC2E5U8_DIPCM|nr:hypothetical protein O6H91_03G040600 [Diphasiastrum complanatum]KAJ7561771.1 hypothetical protein O6H91_03G040600 [Diphasiastrum complanatum]
MGAPPPPTNDETVVVHPGKSPGDPTVITVNCPDQIGLGSALTGVIFDFGLSVIRGDGRWCFLVFWVLPRIGSSRPVRWSLIKKRLAAVCPSADTHLFSPVRNEPKPKKLFLLLVCSPDRSGLLHDMSQTLWELELNIHKVKVSTRPDGKAEDLFLVTDNRDMLPAKNRIANVCQCVKAVLVGPKAHCELREAGPEYGDLSCTTTSYLSPLVVNCLFKDERREAPLEEDSQSEDVWRVKATLDNMLSPAHTLVQIICKDRKGLLYDSLRTLKDFNLKVAYGRFSINDKGNGEIDIFVTQAGGRKLIDPEKQKALCSRLQKEIRSPFYLGVVMRGPDTELLVAAPIDSSGRGRPRVLYDVTLALKTLSICIFQADIGKYIFDERQWEVYRFLLSDVADSISTTSRIQNLIADRVRSVLIG